MSFSVSWVYKARDAFSPIAKKVRKSAEQTRRAINAMGTNSVKANARVVASARQSALAMGALGATSIKSNASIAAATNASTAAILAQNAAIQGGVSPYISSMKAMENSTRALGRRAAATKVQVVNLVAAGKKISSVGRGMMMETTLPVVGVSAIGLVRSAQFESFRISFGALMKDTELGKRTFQELVAFAEKTPFDLREVMKGSQVLLSMGLTKTPEGLIDLMTLLGDITALSPTADLNAIAINMAQIKGIGKMQMMDFKQFATAGIPIKQAILDVVNAKRAAEGLALVGSKDFFMAMEAGAIPFSIVEKAMRHLVTEGQPFFKGMEKQAKTLGGRWSNFVDVLNTTAAAFGDLIEKTLGVKAGLTAVTAKLQHVQKWFVKMKEDSGWQGKLLIWATAFTIVLAPMLFIVGRLVSIFGFFRKALLLVATLGGTFTGLTSAFQLLAFVIGRSGLLGMLPPLRMLMVAIGAIAFMAQWEPFRNLLSSVWDLMGRLIDRVVEFGKSLATPIPDWMRQFIESPGTLVRLISGGKTAGELGDIAGNIVNSLSDTINKISPQMIKPTEAMVYNFSDYIGESTRSVPPMTPALGPTGGSGAGVSQMNMQIGLDRGLKMNGMTESSKNMKTHFNVGPNAISGLAGTQ